MRIFLTSLLALVLLTALSCGPRYDLAECDQSNFTMTGFLRTDDSLKPLAGTEVIVRYFAPRERLFSSRDKFIKASVTTDDNGYYSLCMRLEEDEREGSFEIFAQTSSKEVFACPHIPFNPFAADSFIHCDLFFRPVVPVRLYSDKPGVSFSGPDFSLRYKWSAPGSEETCETYSGIDDLSGCAAGQDDLLYLPISTPITLEVTTRFKKKEKTTTYTMNLLPDTRPEVQITVAQP